MLKDSKYHMKYIYYYYMKYQWNSALRKTKIETDLKETENINKQDFGLFTQVTTTSFLVKVIGTVSLSLLQLHLTQEW